MVVKDKIGRRRYILARNEPQLRALIKDIRKIDEWAKIVYYDEKFAIIRCKHWHKDKVLEFLHVHDVETYATSGTIKKTKKIMKSIKI